jgi:hypothetical protein
MMMMVAALAAATTCPAKDQCSGSAVCTRKEHVNGDQTCVTQFPCNTAPAGGVGTAVLLGGAP